MNSVPLGLLIGLAAMAGVGLGIPGVLLALLTTLGFLLLDAPDRIDRRQLATVTGVVVVVAAFAALRGQPSPPVADPRLASATTVTGVVRSMPSPGARFDTALFQVETATLADGSTVPLSVPVLASVPVSLRANVGDRLELGGEFTALDGLEPGYRRYVEGRQAAGVFIGYGATLLDPGSSPARMLVTVRRDLTDRLRGAIPGDPGALAAGIVTGDDSALDDDTSDAFQTAGLSHVTAVSGQNIAMLAGLMTLLLRGRAVRRAIIVHVVTLALIWSYVGMTGFGAPALRAGLFATFAFAASRFGRKPDFLTILALVSGGMLLANPSYVSSVSFWLSMAASAALVTAFGDPPVGVREWGMRAVGALVTAQLATVPIAIAVFGTWSLGSIPANLIVGPLMQVAFPLCFLLAGCLVVVPFVAPLVALAAELPLAMAVATAKAVASAFPRMELAAGGTFVVMAAAVPCCVMIAVLSEDARRWWARVESSVRQDEGATMAAIAGLLVGSAAAILVMEGLLH
ncbi:MAG: ComEC/Rec2 family competence protein [Thermomicrobiales bacterium]